MAEPSPSDPAPAREPLSLQVLDKMSALLTAAFGLVAALAWNEAVKAFMAQYLGSADGFRALFVYAILVTIIAVLVTLWIAASMNRIKRRLERRRAAGASPQGP